MKWFLEQKVCYFALLQLQFYNKAILETRLFCKAPETMSVRTLVVRLQNKIMVVSHAGLSAYRFFALIPISADGDRFDDKA